MSNQKNHDFFDDLMFGGSVHEEAVTEEQSTVPTQETSETIGGLNQEQLAQMMQLAQSIGPTLKQISPYVKLIQGYFKK